MFEISKSLNDYMTLVQRPSVGEVRQAVARFITYPCGEHEMFAFFRQLMKSAMPGVDFESALFNAFAYMLPEERYSVGLCLSNTYFQLGEYDLCTDFWNLGLGDERAFEEGDDGGQISDGNQMDYDTNPLHLEAAFKVCSFALAQLPQGMLSQSLRVIDVCCGSGLNTLHLRPFSASMIGIDLELTGMKKAGRESAYDLALEGDAGQMLAALIGKVPPQDLLVCTGGTYFFRELDWLFAAAVALLAPGGALVFNEFGCDDKFDARVTLGGTYRWCHSERMLRELAQRAGLVFERKQWMITYNIPTWLVCVRKPSGQ